MSEIGDLFNKHFKAKYLTANISSYEEGLKFKIQGFRVITPEFIKFMVNVFMPEVGKLGYALERIGIEPPKIVGVKYTSASIRPQIIKQHLIFYLKELKVINEPVDL